MRGSSTLGQGACAPHIEKLADHSDDFWGPKMLQNPNFIRAGGFDPAGGAYSAPLNSLSDGKGLAACLPPKNPTPHSALRASCLQVSGSNPLQSRQPLLSRTEFSKKSLHNSLLPSDNEDSLWLEQISHSQHSSDRKVFVVLASG